MKNFHIIRKLLLLTVISSMMLPGNLNAKSDTTLIKKHLTAITKTEGFRNYQNIALLNTIADYIYTCFESYADTVFYQSYNVRGGTYKNVVCRFGTSVDKPVMVIGAHYDVCGDQEGADDNASGVVALLELARLLHNKELSRPVELVAYTLEEPPFFRTPHMGSAVHAKSLKNSGRSVFGMAAIEMIGYFDEDKWSQDYPVKPLKMIYGTKGDYILLVKKSGYGDFVRQFSAQFDQSESSVETRNLKAPAKIQGIDFSDHLNYWNEGYDALMVTNTAFYRNKNYHQTTDVMETLDIDKMSDVITSIYQAVINIDKDESQPASKGSM